MMKVLMVEDDQVILDLVAHFVGIAIHHNVNAAPSATAARKPSISGKIFKRRAHSGEPNHYICGKYERADG